MVVPGEALPPPRELRPFEERVRLMEEVLPALTATERSACGRVRATVGHRYALNELWLDWEKLRDEFALRRDSRNELVGAECLARLIESTVVSAARALLVAVNDAFHTPAPSRASLENQYYDDYWALPEWERPDSADEYIRARVAAGGRPATPEQQRQSDERAARERLAEALRQLPSDPRDVLRSEPGVFLPREVAEGKEYLARELGRLRRIDTSTARFAGADDPRAPSVVVTSDYTSPFLLWLHPQVFSRVGSRLAALIPVCAAKAHAQFAALVEGPADEAEE